MIHPLTPPTTYNIHHTLERTLDEDEDIIYSTMQYSTTVHSTQVIHIVHHMRKGTIIVILHSAVDRNCGR